MTAKMIEDYAALHGMAIPEVIEYIKHELIYRLKEKSPHVEGQQGKGCYDPF